MLVSEIGTRVKRAFGDEAGVQITDADIIMWINDVQRDICSANDVLEATATGSSTAGVATFPLPVDVQTLYSVWYNNQRLDAKSMREAEELVPNIGNTTTSSQATEPLFFYVWADTLNFWPVPSAAGTIKLFYSRFATTVTSINDTPELDTKYHNIIVNYCLQKAYELDEDWQASQTKAGQVNSDLSSLANDEKWTSKNTYPVITVLAEDY